ncbi:MAG: 50S ribosomal protein L11 methyltransferase [Deferrisomatales bacterium]|nr:50S ribosomal protein L11 methyltransferase [Deferrisomatales bacterium]
MLRRTRWRVVEEPSSPGEAISRWVEARARGAAGAVTSWGSGISGRETLRLFWERDGEEVPPGEDLEEENWTPFWRESLRTTAVTERISLVPAWEDVPTGIACPLRIDPGMAFGAGDHPTTRLCLRVLEDVASGEGLPARVLDVGSGTGVLALAAACLGAAEVDALDIDPFGYAACRRNAALNGLEERVRPLLLSLDLLDGAYPLVLANVVVGQIEVLAPFLRLRLAAGGTVILSGFESEAASRAAQVLGLTVRRTLEEGG